MNSTKRRQAGFTILEALVSLVIMGFGIFSLSGMQIAISSNADIAKQRTEAVRLAEEKIEFLRSYTGIASTVVGQSTISTSALNWNDLAGGSDSITTNAIYTRTWTLGGAIADPMRALTVGVTWTDRANAAQAVSLSSILSKTDPADSGFLGFPLPLNTNLKRPMNRNLNIPIPSIDLGTGSSAVAFGTSGQYVLFSNISGDVVQLCTPSGLSSSPTTAQIITALTTSSTNNCKTITGYIVSGYVGQDSSVSNSDWNAIQNGLGIDYSGITRNAVGAVGITCQFGNAVDQGTGAAIAGYKYYICVIPLTAPATPPSTNGPYNWSGKILIAGPSVWHGSGNKYFVCRYQYAAANDLTDVNQMNVQPYVNVNVSLDQQNYLIATTSSATPTCPTSMNVASVSTGVLHQDCRSAFNANYAADCPLLGSIPQYTITYYGNTNTGGTAPTDAISPYTSGSGVTVLGNTGALTKTGYVFSGWNTLANGTGTAYAAGSSLTITANTTLYAQWTTLPTYTVNYSGNGSTGGTVPTDANNPYTSGSTITVLGNTAALTKTGSTFSSWNTAANGAGTSYSPGATFTIAANATLYAQWAVVTTYTVSYDGNGNTIGTAPTDATYTSGATVTVLGNTGILQRTGYSFNGWNTAALGGGAAYSPGATFTIAGSTTLYAQWTAIHYTVTYNANGGTGTVPTDSTQYTYLNTVTVQSVPTLTRTGYTQVINWNTASNGSGTFYPGGATFAISTTTTLYAQWAINTYTLNYSAGANGSISGATSQTVNYGGSGTAVTAVPNTGYVFVNWSNGSTANPRTDSNVTGNISMSASFAKTYTLTYTVGNCNSITGTTPQTVTSGGSGTQVTAVAHDNGHPFLNWSDGGTTAARTETNVTGNISVTATCK